MHWNRRTALALALLMLWLPLAPAAVAGNDDSGYLTVEAHLGVGPAPTLLAAEGDGVLLASGGVVTWLTPRSEIRSAWLGAAVTAAARGNLTAVALADGRLVGLDADLAPLWTLNTSEPLVAVAMGALAEGERLAVADGRNVYLLDPARLAGESELTTDHPALMRREPLTEVRGLAMARLVEGPRLVAATNDRVVALGDGWETLATLAARTLTAADYDGDGYDELATGGHWRQPNTTWQALPEAELAAVGPGALLVWNGSALQRHAPDGSASLALPALDALLPGAGGTWLVADGRVALLDEELAERYTYPLVAPTAVAWRDGTLLTGTAGGLVVARDGRASPALGGAVAALAVREATVWALVTAPDGSRLVELDDGLAVLRSREVPLLGQALVVTADGLVVSGLDTTVDGANSVSGGVRFYDYDLQPTGALALAAPPTALAVADDELLLSDGARLHAWNGSALRELTGLAPGLTDMLVDDSILTASFADGRYRRYTLGETLELEFTSADFFAPLEAVTRVAGAVALLGVSGEFWLVEPASGLPLHHHATAGAPRALQGHGAALALVTDNGVRLMRWQGGGGIDLALGNGDLAIDPADPRQGELVVVEARVHNRGDAAATASVELRLPGLAPQRSAEAEIAAGESRTFAFTIETATLLGRLPLAVEAFTSDETERSNNLARGFLTVREPPRPDLTVTPLVTPGGGEVDQPVELRALVTNRGETASIGGLLELSAGETLASAFIAPLAPGGQREMQLIWTPHAIGPYTLTLATDEPRDGDRSNDRVTWEFLAVARELPDLVALPETLRLVRAYDDTGLTIEVRLGVENRGRQPVQSTVGLQLDGQLLALAPLSLAPWELATVSLTFAAPGPGSHEVTLTADPLGDLVERDESNNGATAPLFLTPAEVLPDLAVEGLMLASDGADYRLTVTLRNLGPVSGEATAVLYRDGEPLATSEVQLTASALALAEFTLAPPTGTHRLEVVLEAFYPGDSNPDNDRGSVTMSADSAPATAPPAAEAAAQRRTATVAGGVVVMGLLALAATEAGRYRWFPLAAPLYSRIRRDRVLDHSTRQDLLRHLSSHPGQHLRELGDTFGLSVSTVLHHLRTLERESYVRSFRDGRFRRFYPTRVPVPYTPPDSRPASQRRVLKFLHASPGLTPSQLARALGVSRQALHYHLKVLERDGRITLRRASARQVKCYLAREA